MAQKVLEGATAGYRNHPQLERFKKAVDPLALVVLFLAELAEEAGRRGYRFDRGKIHGIARGVAEPAAVTEGQIEYEFALLKAKLAKRDPGKLGEVERAFAKENYIRIGCAFRRVLGGVAEWEKVKSGIV